MCRGDSQNCATLYNGLERLRILITVDFPGSSAGKESTRNAGGSGLSPGSGRSLGEGIGYPLQYSWASMVIQMLKNQPAVWETWVQIPGLGRSSGGEHDNPVHPAISILSPWRIPWTRDLAG